MRRSAIPIVALLVAVAGGAQGQPSALLDMQTAQASNARKEGHDCYTGVTGGKKCNLRKRSKLFCYNCCASNGCTDVALTWCQSYCDGNAHGPETGTTPPPERLPEIVEFIAIGYAELGEPLTAQSVSLLDYAIARGDESTARWALVVLLDAYASGAIVTRTAEELELVEDLVGEIHTITLFHMDQSSAKNAGLRSTARAMAAEHGVLGNHDRAETFWLLTQQVAAEAPAADSNLMRAFARP